MFLLSKRTLNVFSAKKTIAELSPYLNIFINALKDYNKAIGDITNVYSLTPYIQAGSGGYPGFVANPGRVKEALTVLMSDAVRKIEDRGKGFKSGGFGHYTDRLKESALDLLEAAHEADAIPISFRAHWGLQLVRATKDKTGDKAFEREIEESKES